MLNFTSSVSIELQSQACVRSTVFVEQVNIFLQFSDYFSNCYVSSPLQFISGCHFIWYLEPIKVRLSPFYGREKRISVKFWLAEGHSLEAVKPSLNSDWRILCFLYRTAQLIFVRGWGMVLFNYYSSFFNGYMQGFCIFSDTWNFNVT